MPGLGYTEYMRASSTIPSRIAAVGFDLDGTLYPAVSLYLRNIDLFLRYPRFLSVFSAVRREIRTLQEQSTWTAAHRTAFHEAQAELVARRMGISSGHALHIVEDIIYTKVPSRFRTIQPYPGVRKAIEVISRSGLRIGLLSDLPPAEKLKALGLADLFPIALCSEDFGVLKPHPRPFLELARALGAGPQEMLYVGNSCSYDVQGAHRAGFCAALRGIAARDAAFSFTSWHDLAQWIASR